MHSRKPPYAYDPYSPSQIGGCFGGIGHLPGDCIGCSIPFPPPIGRPRDYCNHPPRVYRGSGGCFPSYPPPIQVDPYYPSPYPPVYDPYGGPAPGPWTPASPPVVNEFAHLTQSVAQAVQPLVDSLGDLWASKNKREKKRAIKNANADRAEIRAMLAGEALATAAQVGAAPDVLLKFVESYRAAVLATLKDEDEDEEGKVYRAEYEYGPGEGVRRVRKAVVTPPPSAAPGGHLDWGQRAQQQREAMEEHERRRGDAGPDLRGGPAGWAPSPILSDPLKTVQDAMEQQMKRMKDAVEQGTKGVDPEKK